MRSGWIRTKGLGGGTPGWHRGLCAALDRLPVGARLMLEELHSFAEELELDTPGWSRNSDALHAHVVIAYWEQRAKER